MMTTKTARTTRSNKASRFPYHAFIRQTIGYGKERRGKKCEDAAKIVRTKNALICAVADGHGDKRCKYADLGSGYAVGAACEIMRKAVAGCSGEDLYERIAEDRDAICKKNNIAME